MSLTLHTYTGHTVPASTDRIFYNKLTGNVSGVVEGITPTASGGLDIHVTDGWGIIKGRLFTVEAETITVTGAFEGTMKGRLILQIDMSNDSSPISFISQVDGTLPALVQEDINAAGTIYQHPICTYNVTPTTVSNLRAVDNVRITPASSYDIIDLDARIAALEARQNISVSVSGTTATITTA